MQWFAGSNRVMLIVETNPGQVKPHIIKPILVVYPLSTQSKAKEQILVGSESWYWVREEWHVHPLSVVPVR
jgi:hypothetical protein